MRVIYMGTPDFAVYGLEAIVQAGHEVVACFTQPDKSKGRSKSLLPTPIKTKALELNIPVYQPDKIREATNVLLIKDINPDIIVVAAFGQILPESILDIPKYGCINIHASLLPKYRGAAPIEWAIIDGEIKTGVTTMYMEKSLDTGDMIDKVIVPISETDTAKTLHDKLAVAGSKLIIKTINELENGTALREKQDDSLSCYAKMLYKDMGNMEFARPAVELERMIRGLNPAPSAFTKINDKKVQIFKAMVVEGIGKPGEIIEIDKKNFTIACGEKALKILEIQPEGKKKMDCASYLNGNKLSVGTIIGKEL